MIDIIRTLIDSDVPVLLWGPPGVGKTAVVHAEAKAAKAHVETLIGSTLDPADVGGWLLPNPAERTVVQCPPPWAQRLKEALQRAQQAWLFLDELSCSPASVQAALLRVVNERQVAGLDLRGIRVIGASNPADTAAVGGWLSPASSNRWAHVDWVVEPSAWVTGVLSGWGQGLNEREALVASSVTSFITRNPSALLQTKGDTSMTFPSPRTWSLAIRAAARVDRDQRERVVAALVGGPAAREWGVFALQQELPDPELILAGTVPIPTQRGDITAAALSAVAGVALQPRRDRDARVRRACELIAEQRADVALSAAKILLAGLDGQVPDELHVLGQEIRRMQSRVR